MSRGTTKPRIALIATGGTIAGSGDSSTGAAYTAAQEGAAELLSSVPQIAAVAEVSAFEVSRIGSQDMTDAVQIALARKIDELAADFDGIVVTHGTDTMEETAYFLSLVVKTTKPVVLTGSMRPPTALGADGPRNLFSAFLAAGDPRVGEQGVVVCMNDILIRARDVIKSSTVKVESFAPANFGAAGFVLDNRVWLETWPVRPVGSQTPFTVAHVDALPRVGIVYNHSGVGLEAAQALVDAGYDGIVNAGFGNGTIHKDVLAMLAAAAKKGVAIVRSSRVPTGPVSAGGEVDDAAYGFIAAGSLNPQKARVLLQLGLLQTKDPGKLQAFFDTY